MHAQYYQWGGKTLLPEEFSTIATESAPSLKQHLISFFTCGAEGRARQATTWERERTPPLSFVLLLGRREHFRVGRWKQHWLFFLVQHFKIRLHRQAVSWAGCQADGRHCTTSNLSWLTSLDAATSTDVTIYWFRLVPARQKGTAPYKHTQGPLVWCWLHRAGCWRRKRNFKKPKHCWGL